jgi:predicted aspartyl protease
MINKIYKVLLTLFIIVVSVPGIAYADMAYEATTSINFTFHANLIVVSAQINGVAKDFIFDTGATRTTISNNLIKELGIKEVEKIKARGMGGEVDASIVRIDSISLGNIVLRDFSCGVTDMDNIRNLIGGDISGVLGYDFLSQFRVTIDYQAKQLTLDKYKIKALEPFIITGDTFSSPKFKIKLIRPNQSWQFNTETPLPMIAVILEKVNTSASIRVQAQEMQGPTLEQLMPMVESAISAKIEDYKKILSNKKKGNTGDYYELEYCGKKDGTEMQFKQVVYKTSQYLYNITFSGTISEYKQSVSDFDRLIQSIYFL